VSGDIVSVSYTGYYLTGNIFDKSSDLSVTIDSDGVVAGFEAAVKQLKVGEKCTVLIPSPYAYGIAGSGSIPPFTPIIFDITRND
jgi:FKBP-type peptidyl-prolyl cis-trans isomerase